jgi:Skp family chaperone for outer membrane proteins
MISVLVGIGSIVFSSIAVIIFSTLSIEIVLEAATTLIAFFVSGVCLRQIHEEHQISHEIERRLKKTLIEKIRLIEPSLTHFQSLANHIDKLLDSHGAEQRLKKLAALQQDDESLHRLIERFKKTQTAKQALKDLGLSW